jgi:dTDP-glucose pyrophosphorylase
MINVLFPLAGSNKFFPETEYLFPKPLIDICDKTMIEIVIDNFKSLKDINFIFIVNEDDCKKFHLDNTLKLLTNNQCRIVKIQGETKGAACSALMAIEHIDNDMPLIISNADQIIEEDINKIVDYFKEYDGGVVTFESVHPRWSFVKTDENNFVIEAAEKRPISKNAIAGFYYLKKGKDFVKSAMNMIKKDANVNGIYYIAPSLNEMILNHKKITIYKIDNEKYHTFYTPQKIEEYKRRKQC